MKSLDMSICADIVYCQNEEHGMFSMLIADHILHFANEKKLINADLLIC